MVGSLTVRSRSHYAENVFRKREESSNIRINPKERLIPYTAVPALTTLNGGLPDQGMVLSKEKRQGFINQSVLTFQSKGHTFYFVPNPRPYVKGVHLMIMVDLEKDLSPKEVMGIHDYPAEVAETMYQSMKLLQQTYPNSFIGSNGSGFNVRTLGEESSQTVKWLHVHFAPEGLNNIQPSFYKKASQVPPSVRALILGSEGARLWASLSAIANPD